MTITIEDIIKELPGGFRAMPIDCITLNGMPLQSLVDDVLRRQQHGRFWALIAPNGRAVDSETGSTPCRYESLEDATADAAKLLEHGECSTCGPLWKA